MTGYNKLRKAIGLAAPDALDPRPMYSMADEVLATIIAAGIPIEALANGEKVAVPKEPTDVMCSAGWDARHRFSIAEMPADIYEAMIAAAPKEPTDG